MTDEEAHNALSKMAREHAASDAAVVDATDKIGKFMGAAGKPKPMDFGEGMDLSAPKPKALDFGDGMDLSEAAPALTPGVEISSWHNSDPNADPDKVTPSEPVVKRGNVRKDEPSAVVTQVTPLKPTIESVTPKPSAGASRLAAAFQKAERAPDDVAPEQVAEESKGQPFTVNGEVAKLATAAPMQSKVTPAITGRPPTPPPAAPRDTELEGLQAAAADRRATGQLGKAVTDYTERPTNFLDYAQRLGGGGVSAPAKKSSLWSDYEAEGERPLKDRQERQKSEAEATAKAAAAEKKDPNGKTATLYRSIISRLAPNVADQLQGANAEQMERMVPWLENFAKENAGLMKAKAAADAKAAEDAKKESQHLLEREENNKFREQSHQDSLGMQRATLGMTAAGLGLRQGADKRDADKDARDAAEKAKGHQTSTTTLTDLADAETAIGGLSSLGQKFKDLDMSSLTAKASGKATDMFDLQGTDAAEYKAAALRGMQGVGKIMEGGKLATSDEAKYRQMLPRPGDDERIADQKIKESQEFLRSLIRERVKVLKGAGYNVPDVGGPTHDAGEIHAAKDGRKLRVFKDGTSEVVE